MVATKVALRRCRRSTTSGVSWLPGGVAVGHLTIATREKRHVAQAGRLEQLPHIVAGAEWGAGVESLAQAQHQHGRKERRKVAGRAATVHVLNEVARAAQQKRLHWPRDCNTRDEEKSPNSGEDCPLSNRRTGHQAPHNFALFSKI
jgi:hypothetical protein